MNTRSLPIVLWSLAMPGLLASGQAHAQYLTASQRSAAVYVDLAPDKVLTAQRPGTTTVADSLDLDGDGRFDLRLTAYVSPASFPSDAEARVAPLHDEVAIYSNSQAPAIVQFADGDTIQNTIPWAYAPSPAPRWGSRSTIYPYGNSWLARRGNNPAGIQGFGAWLNGQDGYLGVRLRTGSTWRYGWVRLQVQSITTDQIGITVKDFALANATLSRQPAGATAWQVYPVPATDWLTVQLPGVAAGWLTIRDLTGRVHLSRQLTGSTQLVEVAALPAGLYLLQLQTPTGSLARRLIKQ